MKGHFHPRNFEVTAIALLGITMLILAVFFIGAIIGYFINMNPILTASLALASGALWVASNHRRQRQSADQNQIWQALLQDPRFSHQPSHIKQTLKPFVIDFPATLGSLLYQRVTFETVAQAAVAFSEYLLTNGFAQKAAASAPRDANTPYTVADLADKLQEALEQSLAADKRVATNVNAYLQNNGLTERQALGLKGETLRFYDAGTLTIGALLTLQPSLIIIGGNL